MSEPPAARPTARPPESSAPVASSTLNEASPIREGDILVSEEEFRKTLADVRLLITRLNTVISDRDYSAWLGYLTRAYMKTYSDSRILADISDRPLLERQGVRLSSLRDYFLYVVVPSRVDAQVDDLDFVSKDHIRAITVIDGKRYILYDLRLQEGKWKIGVPRGTSDS